MVAVMVAMVVVVATVAGMVADMAASSRVDMGPDMGARVVGMGLDVVGMVAARVEVTETRAGTRVAAVMAVVTVGRAATVREATVVGMGVAMAARAAMVLARGVTAATRGLMVEDMTSTPTTGVMAWVTTAANQHRAMVPPVVQAVAAMAKHASNGHITHTSAKHRPRDMKAAKRGANRSRA
eukprot:comp21107_c0_seq1/m.28515 comp21107_c0_seq1/g.28515  ORF comp21107_c0_seq1/g.28515 comp21107_c0_seq1/m.28515 type:complete len:182 (-) comp21107_c0_seq1:256-801(-)